MTGRASHVHFVPAEHESGARIAPICLDRRHGGRAPRTTTSGQGVARGRREGAGNRSRRQQARGTKRKQIDTNDATARRALIPHARIARPAAHRRVVAHVLAVTWARALGRSRGPSSTLSCAQCSSNSADVTPTLRCPPASRRGASISRADLSRQLWSRGWGMHASHPRLHARRRWRGVGSLG